MSGLDSGTEGSDERLNSAKVKVLKVVLNVGKGWESAVAAAASRWWEGPGWGEEGGGGRGETNDHIWSWVVLVLVLGDGAGPGRSQSCHSFSSSSSSSSISHGT